MPGSIEVTRTPVPCRSQRRSSENWRTNALVRAIDRAAAIGIGRRDRAQVDDRALALDQAGQQVAGERDQAGDVGLDDVERAPARSASCKRLQRRRQAGIVEQHVDRRGTPPAGRRARRDAVEVAHVELERAEGVAQLAAPARRAARGAGRCRSPCQPAPAKRRARGGADAGGGAGDQDRLGHAELLLQRRVPAPSRSAPGSTAPPRPNRRSGRGRAARAAWRRRGAARRSCAAARPPGACLATDSWWTARSSTNTVALGRISSISSSTGRPLPPRLHSTRWRISNALELLDPAGLIFVADIGEDDDVGLLGRSPPAPRPRRARRSGGASRSSKKPSSSGQTRSSGDRLAVGVAQRVAEAGGGEIEAEAVRLRHPVGEVADHVEQHLVAVGDEQGRPAHRFELRGVPRPAAPASRRARRRQAIRSGSCASRKRRIAASRPRLAEPLAQSLRRRGRSVSSSRRARASSPQRPAERGERQRLGRGRFVSLHPSSPRIAPRGSENPGCRGQRAQSEAVLRPAARARLSRPSRCATAARRWSARGRSRPTSSSWTSRCRMSAGSS